MGGSEIYIRQTKRSTFRPMNTMNGDFLSKLKKPRASEMSRDLKGQNAAHNEVMKKQLDLWYRERNIVLGKMNRGQEEVYGTLLHVHKEKKKLMREAWKKQQEESRERALADRGNMERADVLHNDLSPEPQPDRTDQSHKAEKRDTKLELVTKPSSEHYGSKDNLKPLRGDVARKDVNINAEDEKQLHENKVQATQTSSRERRKEHKKELLVSSVSKEHVPLSLNTKTPKEHTTKVLEVQKHNPLRPLVREKSSSGLIEPDRGPSFVKDLPEKLDCFSSINGLVADEAQGEILPPDKRARQKRKGPHLLPKSPTRLSLPPISEHMIPEGRGEGSPRDRCESSEKKPQSHRGRPLSKSLPSLPRAQSEPEPKMSQIERNKRNARKKEKMRREMLNKENFTLYIKNRNGNIVPSDCPFTRKEFKPPSMREKMFQHKMLQAQTAAIDQQMQKMDAFMEKIDAEERAKRRLRDRQRQMEEEERRLKDAKPREQVGVSLQQLVAAFVSPDALPKGLDPNSFEAMHRCKYVREYDPAQKKQRKLRREEKISSWNNSAFVD